MDSLDTIRLQDCAIVSRLLYVEGFLWRADSGSGGIIGMSGLFQALASMAYMTSLHTSHITQQKLAAEATVRRCRVGNLLLCCGTRQNRAIGDACMEIMSMGMVSYQLGE